MNLPVDSPEVAEAIKSIFIAAGKRIGKEDGHDPLEAEIKEAMKDLTAEQCLALLIIMNISADRVFSLYQMAVADEKAAKAIMWGIAAAIIGEVTLMSRKYAGLPPIEESTYLPAITVFVDKVRCDLMLKIAQDTVGIGTVN